MVKGAISICESHGKVSCAICKKQSESFVDVNLQELDENSVVVFDSLTQLTNSAIANITKNEADDYKLNYDDWGNLGKLMDIFLSHIQQAKYNVIVISHETEAETEAGKKVLVPVGGTRNFSRNVAKYFDHVIYAERKNKVHIFASSTKYATNILTGSRTDVIMEDANKPSLLSIFKPEIFSVREAQISTDNGTSNASVKNILSKLKNK
jgi:adenosyl cobinamide kinase/adenosyl cobinamide phosphate guanylyltransferase